jgi:hypothetical protein
MLKTIIAAALLALVAPSAHASTTILDRSGYALDTGSQAFNFDGLDINFSAPPSGLEYEWTYGGDVFFADLSSPTLSLERIANGSTLIELKMTGWVVDSAGLYDGGPVQLTADFIGNFLSGVDYGSLVLSAPPLATAPATPEPATWAMLLGGFAGLGAMSYRKRTALSLIG